MRESNYVSMNIGGVLKKELLPKFLKILSEYPSKEVLKDLKSNFSKVLRGTYNVDSDLFSICKQGAILWVWVFGAYRLDDLEEFLISNSLPFVTRSKSVTDTDDGDQRYDYYRYEWEPGFKFTRDTQTSSNFSEETSKMELDVYLEAARECKDFKSLPSKINNSSEYTQEFAKRCLVGESVLDILLEKIEGLFRKEITLPEFKVGK